MSKGKILIFSGAAGSGKGTVLQEVYKLSDRFKYSVSMTSRQPRPGEKDGQHYHFVSKEEFETRIASGGFLEWVEYVGNYYGTPRDYVMAMRDEGYIVVLEIETVGALNIMKQLDEYVSIFIAPPTYKLLEKRLRDRGTESEKDILKRLETAKDEVMKIENYQYVLVNHEGRASDTAKAVVSLCEGRRDFAEDVLVSGQDFIKTFFD